ncbi:hypothetical protein SCP_0509620 [Sparassis crispa]|uniref:Uncharacterized protein n=1 Tax=Sparassis crispa TaxID=139825 RepID=A0A401GNV7_9APHY|nr:hypothetical protein SCP_0509620 [Sparassis crispa]GBE83903.1 hypothetical protein SCP_0509620 [Sparassis crispa]
MGIGAFPSSHPSPPIWSICVVITLEVTVIDEAYCFRLLRYRDLNPIHLLRWLSIQPHRLVALRRAKAFTSLAHLRAEPALHLSWIAPRNILSDLIFSDEFTRTHPSRAWRLSCDRCALFSLGDEKFEGETRDWFVPMLHYTCEHVKNRLLPHPSLRRF